MVARALLESTARDAVRWLADHRHLFDPGNVSLPGRRSDKPVVELTFLVRALRDAGTDHPGLAELTELVREVGERPEHRRARPTRGHLVAALFLFAAAYPDPAADAGEHRRLRRLVDLRYLDTLEQTPHRAMEDRLALEWADLRHDLPSWHALAGRSILGADPNPALLDAAAAYQLTHVALYLTAFGSRPPGVDLPPEARTRQLLSTLLVRFVAERHWDLVGELLLSWHLLDLAASPVCDAAWGALLGAVGADGSLAQPRSERDPEAGEDPAAAFEDRYHPTLVLALAADAWSRRVTDRVPSPRPAMTPPPITVTTAAEAATTGSTWLRSVLEQASPGETRTAASALVGLWICAAQNQEAAAALPGAAEQAGTLLRDAADWTRVPAGVALVVAGLLDVDAVPPGLATFVDVATAALESQSVDDLALLEKRVLLHGLGREPAPPALPIERVVEEAGRTPLDAGKAQIQGLLLTAEAATLHGHLDVDLPADGRWVPELLLALAAHQARRLDLVTAGRLTRAAVHLDDGAPGRTDLAEVLLAEQRPTGEFGVPGIDVADGSSPTRERDLVLRLTVDCLWTIAEVTTPWRLTTAIRRSVGPPRS